MRLLARRRNGAGDRFAPDAPTLAQQIVDQVTEQTVDCLLEAAFDEDRGIEGDAAAGVAVGEEVEIALGCCTAGALLFGGSHGHRTFHRAC